MNEVRELDRVAQKEDRRIISHDVEIALFGIKLDGKASGIALPAPPVLSFRADKGPSSAGIGAGGGGFGASPPASAFGSPGGFGASAPATPAAASGFGCLD